jgi:hypothetical protein
MSSEQSTAAGELNRRGFIQSATLIAGFLGGTMFAPARAQSLNEIVGGGAAEDRSAVFSVLQDYLQVTDKQDETSIAKAFDPVALLMSITAGGEVVAMSQAAWWGRVSRVPAGRIHRTAVVRLIDVMGKAAIARVDVTTAGSTSTDYFNLLLTRNGWRIVNKTLSVPLG